MLKYFYLIIFYLFISNCYCQNITVIDNKGTIKEIDNSKWTQYNAAIYNKNTGTVVIGPNLGPGIANDNAALQFTATNKGILIPRIGLTQLSSFLPFESLTASDEGLLVYNTASINDVVPGFYYWDKIIWKALGSADALGSGKIFVGNDSNVASAVTMSGDASISNTGSVSIGNGVVNSAKIADSAVTSLKIADNAVTSAKIADSAVTSAKIADATIATADIANNAVTVDKLPSGANASNFLRGDGSWVTPTDTNSGGTVTATAAGNILTANAIVLGAGTTDTKVSIGITTDGGSALNLGVSGSTLGKVKLFGSTSGDVTIQPKAVAGTSVVLTLPATTGTLATLAGTESLTNKTFGTAAVNDAPSIGSTSTIDFATNNLAATSVTANLYTLNNMKNGGAYTLILTNTSNNGTASFTQTTPSELAFKNIGTQSMTTGKTHIFSFIVVSGIAYVTMGTEN